MSYRSDAIADDETEPRRRGHPVMAVLICLLIAIAGASKPQFRSDGSGAYMFGYVFGGGLLMCAIAWAITIRHSSRKWQIGSLLAIFLLFALSGLSQIGQARMAEVNDLRSANAQMEKIAQSGEINPIKPGDSPLGKMSASVLNAMLADQQAFSAKAKAAGLNSLITFDGIEHDSAILRNCPSLGSLANDAHNVGASYPRHVQEGRTAGEDLPLSDEQRDAFVRGAMDNAPRLQHQWDVNADMVREAQALCAILSRGNWIRHGTRIDFSRDSDLREATPHLERLRSLQAESQRLARESRQAATKSLATLN